MIAGGGRGRGLGERSSLVQCVRLLLDQQILQKKRFSSSALPSLPLPG